MMTKFLSKIRIFALTLMVGLFCSASAFGTATIVIKNDDAAGVGFNDPMPVAPIGGNPGTTLGQQRLNAFQFAANIWGATLTSGSVITVRARWMPLECTDLTAVLGSAGATTVHRNFLNAPFANTWYGPALAGALAGTDVNGGTEEIQAQFNLNIGTTGCLTNRTWYYGLDNNHGGQRINLVTVLLHELGHGLGFSSFTNEETGALFAGSSGVPSPSIYDRFLLDNSTGKTWVQMTDAERVTSATNNGNLVWNGPQVVTDAVILNGGKDSFGRPRMYAPTLFDNGSSVAHWDKGSWSPNLLMEPNINTDLSHSVTMPEDLTFSLLRDIGWCAGCPQPPPPPPPAPAPANDNFASAQTIGGCSGSVSSNNSGATREPGEPSHNPDPSEDPGGASVWYLWQAPSNGLVTIELTSTNNPQHDTMLGVYTGNSVGALSAVARNDDIVLGTNTNSRVQFTASANTVYKIAAAGWDSDQGAFTLSWTQNNCTQPPPPVVLTEEGTSRAVALDSVTQAAGPFPITGLFNFSADRYTRVMIFTSNLGTVSAGDVSVQVNGLPLVIESFGNLPGVSSGSYLTVRLTDLLPAGTLPLTVTLRGVTSNVATIAIVK